MQLWKVLELISDFNLVSEMNISMFDPVHRIIDDIERSLGENYIQ